MDLSEYLPRRPGSEPGYELIEEAVGHHLRGRRAEALQTIERAIERFVAGGDPQGEHRAHAKAAILYREAGELDRAADEARLAMAYFDSQPEPLFHATAALELGQVHFRRSQHDAALVVFGRELALLGAPAAGEPAAVTQTRAFIEDCAANVQMLRGEPDAAAALRRRALPVFEAQGLDLDAATGWTNLVIDQLQAGDLEGAEASLGRAQHSAGRIDHRRSRARVAMATAMCLHERLRRRPAAPSAGELEPLRAAYWKAISTFEQGDDEPGSVPMRLELADAELAWGDPEEAAHLLRTAARRLPPPGADSDAVRRGLGHRLDALRLKHTLRALQSGSEGGPLPAGLLESRPGVEVTVTESPWVGAAGRGSAFEAATPEELFPFYWADSDPERALIEVERLKSVELLRLVQRRRSRDDATVAQLAAQEAMAAAQPSAVRPLATGALREAFVDYHCCDGRILAFVELPGRPLACHRLAVGVEEVAEVLADFRRSFDGHLDDDRQQPGIARERPFDVGTESLDAIGRRLMPFRAELSGATVLRIFPSGPLAQFPFHCVRDEAGVPLVAQHAVAYGLSRRLLAFTRGAGPAATRPRSALAIGVPAADEADPAQFLGDGGFLAELGVPAQSLESPAETTPARVLDALPKAELIHFNCHGVFSAASPLDSGLLLSDGTAAPRLTFDPTDGDRSARLTARSLFPLRLLPGATVVLRACASGVTRVRAGDEQDGLLRALVHAGAATCIVTRWNVDIESSRELIRRFYRHWLGGGLPQVVALQRAQLDLLQHPGHAHYRHPYHWAPFVLVGAGR